MIEGVGASREASKSCLDAVRACDRASCFVFIPYRKSL